MNKPQQVEVCLLGLARAGTLPATKKPQFLVKHHSGARNARTYKAGFEWRDDIFFTPARIEGMHGDYTFNAQQTALPSTQGDNTDGGTVGLPYASFLLGRVNNAFVSNTLRRDRTGTSRRPRCSSRTPGASSRGWGSDYGLRWDRQAFGYEKHDRRSMFSPELRQILQQAVFSARRSTEGTGTGRVTAGSSRRSGLFIRAADRRLVSNQFAHGASRRLGPHVCADRKRRGGWRLDARRRRMEHDQLTVAGVR